MIWISWINFGLGLWLAAAAFLIPHRTGSGVVEDLIAGLFVALASLWAARAYRLGVSVVASWTVLLSGLWVAVAPFALNYERPGVAVANDTVVGLAIMALGITNLVVKDRRSAKKDPEPAKFTLPPRGATHHI